MLSSFSVDKGRKFDSYVIERILIGCVRPLQTSVMLVYYTNDMISAAKYSAECCELSSLASCCKSRAGRVLDFTKPYC